MTPTQKDSTALQELIERIEVARQRGDKKFRPAFDYWLHEAKSLLPKDRKGYEEAWNDGEANQITFQSIGKKEFNSGADYFNKTFKQ